MSANHLWNPMRVKNFMRELKMKATKWDENIVALAEKGSMSVEEFLKTDPITFGEKIWGKQDWKYTSGYSRIRKILGDSIYRDMLCHYYEIEHANAGARAFMDAKVAAIKEQMALGLATYMGVSAEDKTGWECVFAENKAAKAVAAVKAAKASLEALNEAEKAAGVCQDGWHAAALEHANALFKLKEADAALADLRQKATEQKEWDERYAAAVEEDERYFAGRTFEQVVADEEEAAAEKRAAKGGSVTVEDIKSVMGGTNMMAKEALEIISSEKRAQATAVKNHIVFNPEDEEEEEDEHEAKTEWTCEMCSAVWRTKTKTE